MDSLLTVTRMMESGCFMASIDCSHAYFSFPLNDNFRKLCKFLWKGHLYEFTCLVQGLACSPRKYTKCMKPIFSSLLKRSHLSSSYIDDTYLQGLSYDSCAINVLDTLELMLSLGLTPHPEKSVLIPTQELEYLGHILDSVNMRVNITSTRADKVKLLCRKLLNADRITIRETAQVIGCMVACFEGVLFGQLFYRQLDMEKTHALKQANGNFDAFMEPLSRLAKSDIEWWINNIGSLPKPISHGEPSTVVYTDASGAGWGGRCGQVTTGGAFSAAEKLHHINALELLAVKLSLASFPLCHTHIRIMSDNITTVSAITHMGTSHSRHCNSIARDIWLWAMNKNIWLSAAHIPGKINYEADRASRRHDHSMEWMLQRSLFLSILTHYDYMPTIDLFASRINKQLVNYVSFKPDPDAKAVDAFTFTWSNLKFYAFPPFSVIQRVMQKIKQDKARGIVILPDWPTQSWYPMMRRLLIQPPFHLPRGKRSVSLPSHPQQIHPLHNKLRLMACLLSGENMRT